MKIFIPLLMLLLACQKSQPQTDIPEEIEYEGSPQAIEITGRKLSEASGLTYSNSMKGKFWVNQDSGNPPYLYLLGNDGLVTDSIFMEGLVNRDWEEVVTGPGPMEGKTYLYIGEIGDNTARYPAYTLYRFEEPAAGGVTINSFEEIHYTYADGARDAEAFIVERNTLDIYIITKRESKSRVYKLASPQQTGGNNIASFVMELPYSNVVSAALSPSDEEILVKTYTHVYHYKKEKGGSVITALQAGAGKMLSYQLEPQGEAISFAQDNGGFYTLGEEAAGIVPRLFFYKKK